MGNESSKSRHPSSSNMATARATTSLPSFSLKSGPSSSIVQRHLENSKKTRVLQLKGCGMKAVPSAVEETVDIIRTLDLSQNKLRELPPYFDNFSMIKQLILAENKLTHLPDELGRLKSLELLNVSNNELTSLPDTLVGCHTLKTLTASFNQISNFPLVISYLPNVECVDLSGNLIESIPEQISTLHAIELNLNRNRLNSIHPNLAKCPNLKVLRVDENCLQNNQFSKSVLEESKISLITYAGNLFQDKDFQSLPGYETYQVPYHVFIAEAWRKESPMHYLYKVLARLISQLQYAEEERASDGHHGRQPPRNQSQESVECSSKISAAQEEFALVL